MIQFDGEMNNLKQQENGQLTFDNLLNKLVTH